MGRFMTGRGIRGMGTKDNQKNQELKDELRGGREEYPKRRREKKGVGGYGREGSRGGGWTGEHEGRKRRPTQSNGEKTGGEI